MGLFLFILSGALNITIRRIKKRPSIGRHQVNMYAEKNSDMVEANSSNLVLSLRS